MQHGLAVLLIFSFFLSQNLAQVDQQQCMNQLQPCLNYINGNTNPPDSCCRPLDHVIKSMPECLCSLMSIQGADQAAQAGINITNAQTLPGRCGQRINPLGCVTGTPDTRRPSSKTQQNSAHSKLEFSNLGIAVVVAVMLVILQGSV